MMLTVKQVSELTGVSVRTLHYYDGIGLLKPSLVTEAGYRLYDDAALERLGQILLFRELEFSLRDIRTIMSDPDFDRDTALDRQIEMLLLQKQRLEKILSFAEQIKRTGVYKMDFKAFDKQTLKRYEAEAKEKWGDTGAYREYEQKTAGDTDGRKTAAAAEMMQFFAEFGAMKDRSPADAEVQKLVKKLQDHITANWYTCTDRILAGLGQMYAAGGEMTDNIDAAGGEGTALFASKAIAEYCG